MSLSRRHLLGGAVAAGAVGAGALAVPGLRHDLHQLLRPVPEPPHPVPTGPVGTVVSGSFASSAMGGPVGFSIAYPTTVQRGLRVLLELHGRSDDHWAVFSGHRLPAFLAQAVRDGVPPYAIVAVDGGTQSYWHKRASGIDPQRMLLEELLPLLAARGLRTDRLALGGYSMGGYGAILLSEQLGASRVAALVPDSPALLQRWKDTAAGAFDGPDDFAAHDVFPHLDRLRGIPVRITCGTSDPFLPGARAFLRAFPAAERDLSAGGHDSAFWKHVAPAQVAFAGRHLALG